MKQSVWIGFDGREAPAFAVARASARNCTITPLPIYGVELESLQRLGLYRRPTSVREGPMGGTILWDNISDAAMSTEFAVTRFLTPHLAKHEGWAMFMDCDMLVRRNLSRLFELADSSKAVMCVQHPEMPRRGWKMDEQPQQPYARKNWSSVMLFNCAHPANQRLTVEMINELPGRDLHRFCWLEDDEIGALPPEWNWLVGYSDPEIDPAIVHFTDGYPLMPGYEDCAYADEWREEMRRWARFP